MLVSSVLETEDEAGAEVAEVFTEEAAADEAARVWFAAVQMVVTWPCWMMACSVDFGVERKHVC